MNNGEEGFDSDMLLSIQEPNTGYFGGGRAMSEDYQDDGELTGIGDHAYYAENGESNGVDGMAPQLNHELRQSKTQSTTS